jgi:hypothetical protein
MQKRISILNTTTGAANCVTASGLTTITGLTPFHATDLQSFQIVKNLVATPQRWTYSIPLVNSGDVSFRIIQTVNGLIRDAVFTYKFAATASSSELKAAIDTWYAAQGFSGSNTVSVGTPTTGVLVGSASNTNIQMTAITGLTVTYAMSGVPSAALQAGSITNAAPRVVTAAGHGLSTGQVVIFASVAGAGAATVNGIAWRVTVTGTNTFTLDGSTAAGAVTVASATATLVAQAGFGSIADVNADALLNGSTATATQTTYQYNCAQIRGTYPIATNGSLQIADVFEATLWYPANLIASPFTEFTDTAALETALAALVV